MNIASTEDRRSCDRYRTVQYSAYIQRKGWRGRFSMPREAAVLDFNRHGVGLCCDKKFKPGEQLKLTIQSSSERISGLHAVVRYLHREKGESHLGLQFVDEQDFQTVLSNARQSVLASMEGVIMQQLV